MAELTQQERITWLGALGRHLAPVLTPILPPDRELLATGLELAVVVRRAGEPLEVAVTFPLPTPAEAPVLDADLAENVFRNLHDELVLHLGRPWPMTPAGRMLRAGSQPSGADIELFFAPTSGEPADALVLDPFVPPPSSSTHGAG